MIKAPGNQSSAVAVRELAGWPLDAYAYRDAAASPERLNAFREHAALHRRTFEPGCVVVEELTANVATLLQQARNRPGLAEEYRELPWSLGVVDLHRLLAFQRRLVLDPAAPVRSVPAPDDWHALTELAFGMQRSTECTVNVDTSLPDQLTYTLHSANPDLQLIAARAPNSSFALNLTGGTPFFEVAELRGRWFLRDGYHRAYRLLCAGLRFAVAVVLRTQTIEQLGAVRPWFFADHVLFSACPPRVLDFLDDRLTLSYARPRLRKTLHIHIEEGLEPIPPGEPR